MRDFSISPAELVGSCWRHRGLIRALAHREVMGRYRGSLMGILWSFFNPILMLSVYTFVFSVVFKARWGDGGESKAQFALILFAGLIVFNLFSECIVKAPSLILSNANYVKKVIFPLEILPVVLLGSALFHALVSVAVWLIAYTLLFGLPHATALLLPLVLLPLPPLVAGLTWLLASLGVYLRDVTQFIGIVTTVLMFMSPIFYPASALPETYRHLLMINPLTVVIEQTRNVLFWGAAPDVVQLSLYFVGALVVAWFGFAWFQKTRKGFADVL